jgi:hypothetical protein
MILEGSAGNAFGAIQRMPCAAATAAGLIVDGKGSIATEACNDQPRPVHASTNAPATARYARRGIGENRAPRKVTNGRGAPAGSVDLRFAALESDSRTSFNTGLEGRSNPGDAPDASSERG